MMMPKRQFTKFADFIISRMMMLFVLIIGLCQVLW